MVYPAITPDDIAWKLYRRTRGWPSVPTVRVVGQEKRFGKLVFTFIEEGYLPVELEISIYICDKDEILRRAKEAIKGFGLIINRMISPD